MTDTRWRICWRSRVTGHEACSIPLSRVMAECFLRDLHWQTPGLDHWIEPVR